MANTARSMIEKARTQLGYREGPNNRTKYPAEVPGLAWAQAQPWCQTWVSWLAVKTGNTDAIPLTASCLACTSWFKQRKQFHRSGPRPGDLVMYGPSGGTHVDLVTEVSGSRIRVIGGNTGGSYNGAYYNGNGVYEKWTEISNPRIHGFARPKYKTAAPGDQTTVLPGAGGGQKPPATKGKITVKKGMTLLGICALLGVTLGELLTANPQVKNPDLIREGQELNIPDKKGTPAPKPTSATPRPAVPEPDKKKAAAPEAPARTQQNPAVKPEASRADRADRPTTRYTVQRGDTLSGIAVKHGITLAALLDLNADRWPDPDLIHSGQHVYLPGDVRVPVTVNKGTIPCSCKANTAPKPVKPVQPAPPSPTTPTPQAGAVTLSEVMPLKPPVVQKGWDRVLTAAELANARVIYDQALIAFGGQDGPRAAVIGIATAYQESRLQNLPGGHLDSAGLFQQRPSMGWGTLAQVTDPVYAATKFFTTMKQTAPGWKSMHLWEASHKVQQSGSPMAPAAFELASAKLVVQFSGGSTGRHAKPYDPTKDQSTAPAPQTSTEAKPSTTGWVMPVRAEPGTPFGAKGTMWASGQHTGTDFPAPEGAPVVAAGAGRVVEAGWADAYGQSIVIEHDGGVRTRYAHLSAIGVSAGQTVQAGAPIGNVGSTGNSTGPHLHLEFIVNGVQVDPMTYLRG